MEDKTGFFTVSRGLKNHWIHPINQNRKFTEMDAWMDIMASAFYFCQKKLVNGKLIVIPRGYFDTTVLQLAAKWRWDRRTVEKFLQMIELDKMIKRFKINPKSDRSCTVIKVINYNKFQPIIYDQCTAEYKAKCNANCTAKCNAKCTPNKKEKKENNNLLRKLLEQNFEMDKNLIPVLEEWLEYKKKKRKGYTSEKGVKGLYTKLLEYSGGSAEKAQEIINNSIANNYDGIFPLKNKEGGHNETNRSDAQSFIGSEYNL